MDYAARIAHDNGMAGDITVHIRPWSDEDIVADRNGPDDGGVYADPHTIPQNGCAFPLATILLTNGHALMKIAVRTDDGGLVNRDVEGVSEVEPRSDHCATRYL